MNKQNRIRIAIQKSGRLSEQSLNLLAKCGIHVRTKGAQLFYHSENFPLDILLVRDDDIPQLVADGTCDFGIVGTNVLQEKVLCNARAYPLKTVSNLNFANCRLAIAMPINSDYIGTSCLNGKKIATSYPAILTEYLDRNNIDAKITTLSGAVEIAPRLGIADGICDLVSTGATLEANHLKEVATVFESQAVLIKNAADFKPNKLRTALLFQNRIEGSELATDSKYIMLHAPKITLSEIVAMLPGAERPTIMSLEGDTDKVVVHALCRESVFWETMENLKAAGASSILVLPVEKMLA